MIQAGEANIGGLYFTKSGIEVTVISKDAVKGKVLLEWHDSKSKKLRGRTEVKNDYILVNKDEYEIRLEDN